MMSSRVVLSLLVASVALVAGCSPAEGNGEVTTSEQTPANTVGATTTLPLVAGCPQVGDFSEDGLIAVDENEDSDATTLGHISWEVKDACETFAMTFTTSEGAPATTPPSVEVGYLEGLPIIRVRLDVDTTVVTDQLVETQLIDRLFVVRSLDGGMFIDFYLAAPAQASVSTTWSPARITLWLQPGIVDYPSGSTINDMVVVTTPQDRTRAGSPVVVEGYARTFESTVLLIATAGNELLAQEHTTAADSVDTWGEFRAVLELEPGPVSLFVGSESPEDGSLEGVTISLTVE